MRLFLAAWLVTTTCAAIGCQRRLAAEYRPDQDHVLKIREGFRQATSGASASSSSSQPAQQPTGWATLRGVIRIQGQAPARAELDANKDIAVCKPGGRPVYDESLVTGPEGGIKNVLVYLTSKIPDQEPWTHPAAKKTDEVIFDQKQCVFLTHVLAMQTTQKLKILNSDPVGHNTKLDPGSNTQFNATIPVGGSAYYQPQNEERQPFPVACSMHQWMKGWIIVRDNPYFAVTDEEGRFQIANLPAGVDLEVTVWQEKARIQRVTLDGQERALPKGRLVLNLNPNEERELDVRIDASAFR
jgi:hypothetical protein